MSALRNSGFFCVVTTIRPPTLAMRRLAEVMRGVGGKLLVVGDRKGPSHFDLPGAELVSLAEQQRLPFSLACRLPVDHYARKNLGYLLAIQHGAACIYETDDDNMPAEPWRPRQMQTEAQPVAGRPWMNVYRAFSSELIWPRGFPLEQVTNADTVAHDPHTPLRVVSAPIQQGLVNQAPDVDAIWRLILDRPFTFTAGPSLYLPRGTWCPFNSQTTWWWPPAHALLYLPRYCSFRMTDIWRSFIAQRCLWELGYGMVFHGPEAIQVRNPHDLQRDFEQEVPGYLHNQRIVDRLQQLPLSSRPGATAANLVCCYEALVADGFFPREELALVRAWVEDLARAAAGPAGWIATAA